MKGHIVRVHRPDLTPAERAKRMERIKQSATRYYLAAEKYRREKAAENSSSKY